MLLLAAVALVGLVAVRQTLLVVALAGIAQIRELLAGESRLRAR
jgi:hypothetical protein